MAVPGQAALKADGCFGNSQFGVRRLQPYPPRSLTCASRVKPPSTGLGGATRDVPALEVPVPATEPERKRRLFGVRPAPAPAPVSVDVERAAKGLAAQVWSYGSRPRARLFTGINPAVVEEFLAHAIAMQWVVVDGDQIAAGKINPSPGDMTHLADIDGPSWGPAPDDDDGSEFLV